MASKNYGKDPTAYMTKLIEDAEIMGPIKCNDRLPRAEMLTAAKVKDSNFPEQLPPEVFDFSAVSEIDLYRYEKIRPQYDDGRVQKHARDAMMFLLARPEEELGVCSHSGFLGKEILHGGIGSWAPSDGTMRFKWVQL
jgi:hypothetical protein